MKNWNQIFEHHDEEWPQELLSMTIDQFLDKLKEKELNTEYEAVEDILKMHMMSDEEESIPTWDEMKDIPMDDWDEDDQKLSWETLQNISNYSSE